MAIKCEHCGRYWPAGRKGWRCSSCGKGMQGRITPRIQHWNSLNNCSLFHTITVFIGCNTEQLFYYAVWPEIKMSAKSSLADTLISV